MSENIKPSEVSEVLLRQLKDIDVSLQFEEVGTVLQVSDGVVRIYGLLNAEANELLEFDNGMKAIVMNLEEENVGAVLLGPTDQIKEGMIGTKRMNINIPLSFSISENSSYQICIMSTICFIFICFQALWDIFVFFECDVVSE